MKSSSELKYSSRLYAPSYSSAFFVLLGTLTLSGIAYWDSLQTRSDISFFTSSIRELLESEKSDTLLGSIGLFFREVFQGSLVNQVTYIVLCGLVGVIIYVLAAYGLAGNKQIRDFFSPKSTKGRSIEHVERELGERILFRGVAAAFWIVFILATFKAFFPLGFVSVQAASDFGSVQDAYFILLSLIIFSLTLHINVIFLRLFMLRRRVLGD